MPGPSWSQKWPSLDQVRQMWSREAPMPRQTKPIEKNMRALNSRMKLTSWNSSVRSMQQKITWLGEGEG